MSEPDLVVSSDVSPEDAQPYDICPVSYESTEAKSGSSIGRAGAQPAPTLIRVVRVVAGRNFVSVSYDSQREARRASLQELNRRTAG